MLTQTSQSEKTGKANHKSCETKETLKKEVIACFLQTTMVSRPTSPSLLLLLTCLSSLVFVSKAALTVPCKESSECAAIYRKGSECNADGFCTNPFYNGGCLNKLLPGWNKTRICNSEDPPEAEELGYCRSSPLGYSEIRLAARNWEAANFGAWILQILLSEILDVPTSVEGGSHDLNLNLYDVNNGFDIGVAGVDPELKELEVAARVKDCRLVTTDTSDPAAYEPCMHVNQEAYWSWYTAEQKEDFKTFIEPPRELGAITENAFFLPLFAAKNDPTLVSFAGLSGEDNRRKLAETFKTPTTWKQYCEEISETNCAEADVVAARAPQDEIEEESYFVDGLYIGHFRYTPEHDCDLNPSNCQGHLVDVPCGWATYAPSQVRKKSHGVTVLDLSVCCSSPFHHILRCII